MSKPVSISDSNFADVVLQSTNPVLVDFWAPWCGPCKALAPVLDELSAEYSDKVKFTKLNTDENEQSPGKYGIQGIPTLIIFKGGKEVHRVVGYKPKAELKKDLDSALTLV